MSMNKVIHGAFRRDLDRFVAALGTFPAGDRGRAAELSRAWKHFDDQLTHHHEGEHRVAWPALRQVGVSADLLTEMDAEHSTMAAALEVVRSAMADLAREPMATQARKALAAFEDLRTTTVTHLDHEESEIEQVFLDNEDHPALVQMSRSLGRISPVRAGGFFTWLLDGASPDERAAISHTLPRPVLKTLTGLFGRSYRRDVAAVWSR